MPELGSLAPLLKQTSRSFYLTLRVLPSAIRPAIGLAYLLARTTDTIADTGLVAAHERQAALRRLQQRIAGQSGEPLALGRLCECQALPAEAALLNHCEQAVQLLEVTSAPDRDLIRNVLNTIILGQTLDLERFGAAVAEPGRVVALRNSAELDDYTHKVAGCVGEFWTEMCLAHLPGVERLDKPGLIVQGIDFGKGLQRVNILRDVAADLRLGRCYLPADQLDSIGLTPEQLLDARRYEALRPLYHECLDHAEAHLRTGWTYTCTLPERWRRVRLACAWPVLIGLATLAKLRHANPLDQAQRVKINRRELNRILWATLWRLPFRQSWERLA